MASQDWFEKDFYATLGVPSDADATTIKKTYRKLARTMHPDHNVGDTKAEARFKEIGEAYAVLSDPEQRREYDAVRAMSGGGARFTAGGPGGGGAGFEDIFSAFGGAGGPGGPGGRVPFGAGGGGQPNIEDILGQMFGGGGAAPGGFGGFGSTAGPRPGSDVQASTTIPFRDAVEGSTVSLSSPELGRVTARIPSGVKDGQRIRLRGKGRQGDPGSTPGDLILTVSVERHPVFGRDGDNLTVDLPVTFAEAALGATVAVPTLDGTSVKVKVAPGTPSGRVLRLKGRGVTRGGSTGDLLARVQVVVPQRLTDEAREAIEKMAAAEGDVDPRADLFERART
ncbi:DnaJ C-terminal domain-containing protein [Terracoccus luteus]|uniref:Molecular chaperone DnaJ n=1 Tax=Terracoccus luteus TaxID=53356 RepID=A0A839PXI6_9MICO|nr:DnaJ C-terminal domain-containing protein [Terracoccus luteus]MBB2988069.1 molecular chaperone DnaJ [Terracoccus luteus]MCP2173720.1 molecular chaperone DnaJ [Terracoccus luteus]